MTFHNSLVLVSGEHAASAVEAAFLIADRSRGHVAGVHITGDRVLTMPRIVEGMSESQVMREFQAMRDRLETNERVSMGLFYDACGRHGAKLLADPSPMDGVNASYSVIGGRPEEVLPERDRDHDVLISSTAGPGAGQSALAAVEQTIFASGQPVMMVPREVPTTIGQHVLIAWNNSALAACAVMAAMPVIRSAAKVTICHVDTRAKPGPAAKELALSLGWHGVVAARIGMRPAGGGSDRIASVASKPFITGMCKSINTMSNAPSAPGRPRPDR